MQRYLANFLFTIAALALALTACTEEYEYEPGVFDVDGCYGVYFPSQETDITVDSDADKVLTLTACRTNTSGSITVPVELTDEQGIYKVEDIHFEDGQGETTFDVTFEDIENGVSSYLQIAITDEQYASYYGEGATYLDITVLCATWEYFSDEKGDPILFHWTQDWWGEECDAYIRYYDVDGVRTCITETVPESHYYNGSYTGYGFYGIGESEDDEAAVEREFIWYTGNFNSNGDQLVELPPQSTGYYYSSTYGHVMTADIIHWYWLNGSYTSYTWLYIAENFGAPGEDFPVSYYDGNGGFYICTNGYYCENAITSGFSWIYGEYADEIGIATTGFTRLDYSINVSTGLTEDGKVPVYLNLGADVDEVRYGVYEGALSSAVAGNQAAAIANGTYTYTYTVDDNSGFTVACDTTGTYTIVVCAFSENTYMEEYDYVAFTYVTAGDEKDYAPVVTIGVEDTSDRYAAAGYNSKNSFAFYVVGKDLTAVGIAAVPTASYETDMDTYNAEVASNEELLVDDDVLAEINSTIGYADLMTGLSASTGYTLVVYATNGYKETWVTAEYTTDGEPNDVLCTGTGYFKYNILWSGTYGGYDFEYNPNTGNYEIPDWGGYGSTFAFSVDENNNVVVPMQEIGFYYTGYGEVIVADEITWFYHYYQSEGYDYTYEEIYDMWIEKYPDDVSYYTEETDTYTFFLYYGFDPTVSTAYFGDGSEYFCPTGKPATTAITAEPLSSRIEGMGEPLELDMSKLVKSPVSHVAGVDYEFESAKMVNATTGTLNSSRSFDRTSAPVKVNKNKFKDNL